MPRMAFLAIMVMCKNRFSGMSKMTPFLATFVALAVSCRDGERCRLGTSLAAASGSSAANTSLLRGEVAEASELWLSGRDGKPAAAGTAALGLAAVDEGGGDDKLPTALLAEPASNSEVRGASSSVCGSLGRRSCPIHGWQDSGLGASQKLR